MLDELSASGRRDVAAETTDELEARLAAALGRTAADLKDMATIVAELERRGEDLTSLRLGLIDHLRRIAAGQELPEIVVRYSGYPRLLRIASRLPLPDQRGLIDDDAVELACWREGRVEFRRVPPLALAGPQLRQVFDGDRLRTQAEQISHLESAAARPPGDRRRPARGTVRADRQRGGVRIGRSFAPLADVLEALAQLRGSSRATCTADNEIVSLVARVTEEEARAVRMAAAAGGCSQSDVVRRALWAAGILERLHETV